jgi:hypothetical protein
MTKINLACYNRNLLSDMLQIAQQSCNAGYPIPCDLQEQLQAAHDDKLHTELAKYSNVPAQPAIVAEDRPPAKPLPPCGETCTVAQWIKYPCGRMGWECEGKQTGKCGMVGNAA